MDAATLLKIMQLPASLSGAAYLEAVKGTKIRNPRGLALHVIKREERPTAYVSLDEERDEEDGYSLHEKLAAADPADLVDYIRARTAEFDDQIENVFDEVRDGGKQYGESLGLSGRRGQQIIQKQVKNIEEARKFKEGGKGQGGLFGFDGEVV
ncbi:hypothetical protein MIZ01_1602 [Sideroxyarcus emersonii]|uniref:Uncharacterized protein n=1 Tax=Sideroxyarcus emersonii TaxID=2764705 RepID=A0AAN1XAB4_9PROT|nr:hypothetical protein [Sideroxyarcus emersonii]BCK87806.1 hypothetical protein MIZ01_1602 [Sideroxyarcus emersonii]